MQVNFVKERLNLSLNKLKEVAKSSETNFNSLSIDIDNVVNDEIEAIHTLESIIDEINDFLINSYDKPQTNELNENIISMKKIKTELTNLIYLIQVKTKRYSLNECYSDKSEFEKLLEINQDANKIIDFVNSDTGLKLRSLLGDSFGELIFPCYVNNCTDYNEIITDFTKRTNDINLELERIIRDKKGIDSISNSMSDEMLLTCYYMEQYEYIHSMIRSCSINKDYILLDKDFYYTGGGVDIAYYTILKDNTLFILLYDSYGYGSYSISLDKALILRNTNGILSSMGYDGFISFDLLLNDSDIIDKYFKFINGELDIHFKDEKECFEYFESKISETICSLNQ